jgi:hypothetical protein
MPQRLQFSGRYVRLNVAMLRQRANRRDDPRHIFYEVMLENDTYEAYEAAVGVKTVRVETWNPPGPCSGHAEIRYARRNGWIEDARSPGNQSN